MNYIELPQYFFISWEAQTDPEVIKQLIAYQRRVLVQECKRLAQESGAKVIARELNPELSEAKKEMCFIIEEYKNPSQLPAWFNAMGEHHFFSILRRSNERIPIFFPSGKGIIKPLTEAEAKIIEELRQLDEKK